MTDVAEKTHTEMDHEPLLKKLRFTLQVMKRAKQYEREGKSGLMAVWDQDVSGIEEAIKILSCGAESNRHSGAVGAEKRAEQSNPGGGHEVTEKNSQHETVSDKPLPDEPTPAGGRQIPGVAQSSPEDIEVLKRLADSMGFGRTHDAIRRILTALAAQPPAAPVEKLECEMCAGSKWKSACPECNGTGFYTPDPEPVAPVETEPAAITAAYERFPDEGDEDTKRVMGSARYAFVEGWKTATRHRSSAGNDDLIERLRNPMWAHGNIPFESPQLEQEENIAAMNEAAAEIERLRALPQTVVTREAIAEIIDPMSFKTVPGSEAQSRALHKADRILALTRPQSGGGE